jgi:hypothetical protein
MVGTNPEILKRKEIQAAFNPTYISNNTATPETLIQYTLVPGNSKGE